MIPLTTVSIKYQILEGDHEIECQVALTWQDVYPVATVAHHLLDLKQLLADKLK